MKFIKYMNGDGCSNFKVVVSEGELMIYEGAISYILKNCKEEELCELVGCETKEELKYFYDQVLNLLMQYIPEKYLPEKLK